jgi:mannose-6-phosphate isomerase-like protein (cupin superfamily)
MECITVLEGEGEAWMEGHDGLIPLNPGVTLVIPPNLRHWFRALGTQPLKTYGVHASPHRVVIIHQEQSHDEAAGQGTTPLMAIGSGSCPA